MMERVSFEIDRTEVYDALQADAAAHGRSVAEEVAALIDKAYAAKVPAKATGDANWVGEMIEMAKTNNLELRIPARRDFMRRAPDFPKGMRPKDGESFIGMIDRVSRPGIDLGDERERAPHDGPTL